VRRRESQDSASGSVLGKRRNMNGTRPIYGSPTILAGVVGEPHTLRPDTGAARGQPSLRSGVQHLLLEHLLENLARGAFRQSIDDVQVAGVLVCRNLRLDETDQLLL
jgi:hypothetical protein